MPVTLFTDAALPEEWRDLRQVRLVSFPFRGLRWHLAVASLLRRGLDADLYVSPTSFIVPFLIGRGFRVVPVIHDLIAWRGELHDRKAVFIERLTLRRAMMSAAHVCTVSDATRRDLLSHFPWLLPEKVTSVFAGPMRGLPPLRCPDGRSILCVATLCPRKNQHRLIQAYASLPASLRERFSLILAGGRGWHDGEILRLVSRMRGVEWKQEVDDAEYGRLLSRCEVFALPSLYEGFGMQILDALRMGVPVLTSDRGGLREVAGGAALMADPGDVTSIRSGLQTLLQNPNLRAGLSRKGPCQAEQFSWKRTVDLFLKAAEELIIDNG